MVSLRQAQTGKRVYKGVSQSPNRGQVSAAGAQGYIQRELRKQRQTGPLRPKGNDGLSDSRSTTAAQALRRRRPTADMPPLPGSNGVRTLPSTPPGSGGRPVMSAVPSPAPSNQFVRRHPLHHLIQQLQHTGWGNPAATQGGRIVMANPGSGGRPVMGMPPLPGANGSNNGGGMPPLPNQPQSGPPQQMPPIPGSASAHGHMPPLPGANGSNNGGGMPPLPNNQPQQSGPPQQMPPMPPQVTINADGVLQLPYNQQFASDQLSAISDANDQLLALKMGADQNNMQYGSDKRNANLAYQALQGQTLNENAAAGTAYSSRYGTAVANNANSYANQLGDIEGQHSSFLNNLGLQRQTIQNSLNQQLAALAQEYADSLNDEAGSLGYGTSEGNTSNPSHPPRPHRKHRKHRGRKPRGKGKK